LPSPSPIVPSRDRSAEHGRNCADLWPAGRWRDILRYPRSAVRTPQPALALRTVQFGSAEEPLTITAAPQGPRAMRPPFMSLALSTSGTHGVPYRHVLAVAARRVAQMKSGRCRHVRRRRHRRNHCCCLEGGGGSLRNRGGCGPRALVLLTMFHVKRSSAREIADACTRRILLPPNAAGDGPGTPLKSALNTEEGRTAPGRCIDLALRSSGCNTPHSFATTSAPGSAHAVPHAPRHGFHRSQRGL
jgi:hypothetical protein